MRVALESLSGERFTPSGLSAIGEAARIENGLATGPVRAEVAYGGSHHSQSRERLPSFSEKLILSRKTLNPDPNLSCGYDGVSPPGCSFCLWRAARG
jgi:hypothetical protein